MKRKPKLSAEPETASTQSAATSQHYAEIIRPETLGEWALGKNPTVQYLREAMEDWGERRGDPNRRPICMTCPHEFHVNAPMPAAWMFVRLSVNKAGVPRHMILVGVCETCAANDEAILLREGLAELRRAFPNMPEFKILVAQEGSSILVAQEGSSVVN
jgi:hypothetical protein